MQDLQIMWAQNNCSSKLEDSKLSRCKFRSYKRKLQALHERKQHIVLCAQAIKSSASAPSQYTEIDKQKAHSISSNQQSFYNAIAPYQEALTKSGYNHKLTFEDLPSTTRPQKKHRKRNITWYNPPFNKSVSTNVGRKFLTIIKNEFPKSNKLNKIFNTNTVKLSYSCMPNMKNIIDQHNKKLLNELTSMNNTRECNCRNRNSCPMNGQCLVKDIVYQATVHTNDSKETYIGLTSNEFKTRYNNHTASFRHESKRMDTELSKHIWNLKHSNINYTLSWKIITKASSNYQGKATCNLCVAEKYYIIYHPNMSSLNDRRQLVTACRHIGKYFLCS